ncbi:MAG: DUF1460 domain-containing protein [Bacteroidales bacterium]|nr:DUF1460 domain-containing protein [Bacteroidales bacterium]
MKRAIVYVCLLWYPLVSMSQVSSLSSSRIRVAPEDKAVYEKVMEALAPVLEEPMPVVIMKAAEAMLGTPYAGGTLEQEPEMLTVSLARTDCILLVEACVAMAQTARQEDSSFEAFCANLKQLRYRDGLVDGYASRIHYTSEWILQAEARGMAAEVSMNIDGTPLAQGFSYMSSHAEKYPLLAADQQLVARIAAMEERLQREKYYFIPKKNLENNLDNIHNGDMICFVTNTEGLDISHVAFAFEYYECEHDCCPDGRGCSNGQRQLGFLHASSKEMKVVVDKMTLTGYVNGMYSCSGIRVVRFL